MKHQSEIQAWIGSVAMQLTAETKAIIMVAGSFIALLIICYASRLLYQPII